MKKILVLMLAAVMLLRLPVFAAADSSDGTEYEPLEITESTETTPSEPPISGSSESDTTSEPIPDTTPTPSETTTEKEPDTVPEGIQFNINGTTLVSCSGNSKKAIVPDEVTFINAGAFENVQNLKFIVIYNFNCLVEAGAFPEDATVYCYKNSPAWEEAKRAGISYSELTPINVTLKIYYQDQNGVNIHQPYEDTTLKTGDQYLVLSPQIPGYTPNAKEVTGYASREDITITVTYSVSSDSAWTIDGPYIKYTENGEFLKNTSKTIDGVTYNFNSACQLVLEDEFITIKGKTYYLDKNNRIVTGYRYIKGAIYYFTQSGTMLTGAVRDGYIFDDDGKLCGNDILINVDGNSYYLKNDALYSGFVELEGNIYYFGSDFYMIKNQTLDGFTYNGLGHLVVGITIDKLIFSTVPNAEYTGEEHKPSVTVKFGNITLIEDIHYELVYSNNIEPGSATVEIKGIGAVSGSKKLNFTIIGENAYTLTIRYVNPSDQPLAEDYVSKYEAGKEYVVYCPYIPGYIAENAVTAGTMPKSDVTITVIYSPEIVDEPIDTDNEPGTSAGTEQVDPKPPVSSSIVEIEGTTQTNIEKENVITKVYAWDLLFIVFTVATIVCGGTILIIINWDYIKRSVFKRPSKRG